MRRERSAGRKGVCSQNRCGKVRREESSVSLGAGRENTATARNVIDLSKVYKNTSRIVPNCVFTHTVYAVPGPGPGVY